LAVSGQGLAGDVLRLERDSQRLGEVKQRLKRDVVRVYVSFHALLGDIQSEAGDIRLTDSDSQGQDRGAQRANGDRHAFEGDSQGRKSARFTSDVA
jgi:hypothetical protein